MAIHQIPFRIFAALILSLTSVGLMIAALAASNWLSYNVDSRDGLKGIHAYNHLLFLHVTTCIPLNGQKVCLAPDVMHYASCEPHDSWCMGGQYWVACFGFGIVCIACSMATLAVWWRGGDILVPLVVGNGSSVLGIAMFGIGYSMMMSKGVGRTLREYRNRENGVEEHWLGFSFYSYVIATALGMIATSSALWMKFCPSKGLAFVVRTVSPNRRVTSTEHEEVDDVREDDERYRASRFRISVEPFEMGFTRLPRPQYDAEEMDSGRDDGARGGVQY